MPLTLWDLHINTGCVFAWKKYGSQGTRNLVAAAMQAKVKKFVLVTSIGTDDPLFPLNLLFGVRLMPFLLHAVSAAYMLAPTPQLPVPVCCL